MPNIGVLAIVDAIHRIIEIRPDKEIVIMDFGGADGSYFSPVHRLFSKKISLEWYVVETPAMVKAMKEFEHPQLHFVSSVVEVLQWASKVDIVFTSGTIQYTRDPWQTLSWLLNVGAPYLIFNRQSLSNEPFDIISVQTSLLSWHGLSGLPAGMRDKIIRYPHTSMRLARFEEVISEKYNILYTFPERSCIKKVRQFEVVGVSYFLGKKRVSGDKGQINTY